MWDSDSSESDNEHPVVKKAKSHDDNDASQDPVHPSQWSQDIIIETGRHEEPLNKRHAITVIVNTRKRKRQQQHREQNTDKLKQYEAGKCKRPQYLLSIAGPSTSSNINVTELKNDEIIGLNNNEIIKLNNDEILKLNNDEIIELKNEEIIDVNTQSTSDLKGTQTLSILHPKQKNDLQKEDDVNKHTESKTVKNETVIESSAKKKETITESSTSSNNLQKI